MTPPIWSDVSADIATALSETRKAAEKAATLGDHAPMIRESVELAIGKHLHDAYCAAETALERIVLAMDGNPPVGRHDHRDLPDRAAHSVPGLRGPVIRPETRSLMGRLASFRHVFRHAYGTFEWTLAADNVGHATEAIPMLAGDLRAFAEAQGSPDA